MERRTVRRLVLGSAILGMAAILSACDDEREGNPQDTPIATVTISVSPRATATRIPTIGASPTATVPELTPTAIAPTQTQEPLTPTLTPLDTWTPPGTVWITPYPTEVPTQPPIWTPEPTIPPTQPPVWTPEPTLPPTIPPTPEPTATVVEGPNYEMANQVTNLINQERLNNGLNALTLNQALVSCANEYAGFLIVNKLYGHDLDGLRAHERAEKYGYVGIDVSEIIAQGDNPEIIVQAWIESPDHHYQMMRPELDEIGVGCYWALYGADCVANFGVITS